MLTAIDIHTNPSVAGLACVAAAWMLAFGVQSMDGNDFALASGYAR
jgi:hypothetical protein